MCKPTMEQEVVFLHAILAIAKVTYVCNISNKYFLVLVRICSISGLILHLLRYDYKGRLGQNYWKVVSMGNC